MTLLKSFFTFFLFLSFLLIFPPKTNAAWLSICEDTNKPKITLNTKSYFTPSGKQFHLVVTHRKPLNCQTLTHEIEADNIKWMEIINNNTASRLGNRVSLQGIIKKNEIQISEIIPQNESPENILTFPLRLNTNTLNEFKFQPFGSEERAQIKFNRQKNEITLDCKKGEKPAGLLFTKPNTRLPLVKNQFIILQYQSTHNFTLAIADQRRFNKGSPITLGSFISNQTELKLPIPREKLNYKTHIHWSILCPEEKSTLKLTSFILQSDNKATARTNKSMWFWKPEDWQSAALKTLTLLKKYKANDIFISIILDEEKQSIVNEDLLSSFITLAKKSDISVWVVEGDPHVVLPKARKRFARRARIFSHYNKTHPANQQLAGIQYDIEPYLLPGYSLVPEQWAEAYVETIKALKNASNMPIEIVIPFWWQNQAIDGKPMLDYITPYVKSINVMNYRTTKNMINLFAEPLLDWGMRNQTPVNIALEAGPIVDETQWRYQQADKGELWSLTINQQAVLLLNHHARTNPQGNSYKLQFKRIVSGDNVTFENNVSNLLTLLPELNLYWSNWDSFNGISLHGLEE